jgi:hypothetical protein
MRKGSFSSPSTDLKLGGGTLTPSPGMKDMGGLMSGDQAGVDIKQLEGVSVGSPNLKTPSKDLLKGSKTPAKAGATINKNSNVIKSPSVDLRKGY